MEASAVHGRFEAGLGGEPIQVSANVPQQHFGQIVGEAVAHHDALHDDILPVGGHAVGGHLPAAIAQPVCQIVERPIRRRIL